MTTSRHRSSFELDTYFASLDERHAGADDDARGEMAAHIAACTTCAAYLQQLRALAASNRAAPATAGRGGVWRRARRLAAPAATVLALAAGALFYVRSRPAKDDTAYVGVKGMPAVQVLVRSGGQTRIWDGTSSVRPGDALAMHVACERLAHVTVASPGRTGLVRLHDDECPATPGPLPFTLRVDDQAGREEVVVVLSAKRLDDVALSEAVRAGARRADAWVTTFAFNKETVR
jgi:hypothetical protein